MNRDYVYKHASAIRNKVIRWGRKNFRNYPWRETEEPWLAIVAEVMLQRTRVSSVESVWLEFQDMYPDLRSAAKAGDDEFRLILEPLGLRWRTELLHRLLKTLDETQEVPHLKSDLLNLPGVGEYVSSAFLSLHAGKREVIVDANVVRWICRLTGDEYGGDVRRQKWLKELADRLTPRRIFKDYNYGVLDFTMNICKAKPDCRSCPISRHCAYYLGQ